MKNSVLSVLFVTKSSELKRKDNVALVNTRDDIPNFLREAVFVSNGKIYIGSCIEGNEVAPTGNFIAWEKDTSCLGGSNVWCKTNGHQTLVSKDGAWYERPTLVKFALIDWSNIQVPEFATNADLEIFEKKIVLHAKWGDQTAEAPEAYGLLGYPTGGFALLKMNSPSAREYYRCTAEGEILEPLVS